MKFLRLFPIALLFSYILVAQKQVNDPNAEIRTVKGFHAIKVSTGIQLMLNQSTTEAVAVSAPSVEHRNRIKTVVENGVLKIYYDTDSWKNWKNGDQRLKAYVSAINIDGLDVSAGASISIEGTVKTNKLDVDASSGAVLKGNVEANSITIDQSSGSVINLSGTVVDLSVDGSSGSVLHGYDLTADNCDVDTSSGSGVQVTVNKELSVEASSGGHVNYKGQGVIKNVKTSSGGNVSRKG
jgi:Putative auto-transporter adhesin, head GIN domain